jgi:N-acetylneuraminate synthase
VNKVKVIAELGVNHNGQEELAFELIDKAVESGADIVKFQTFNSYKLASGDAKKASYQEANTDIDNSQLEMLKGLELSRECFSKLKRYSEEKNIGFLSSAFDKESLDFVVNELDIDFLKIASGELTNAPLILDHARTKKDIILSTGMAEDAEILKALEIIAFGYSNHSSSDPNNIVLKNNFETDEAQKELKKKVTLLHCTTRYPTPIEDTNLNLIDALKKKFNLNVGFSDHTSSILVPALSVLKGIKVIEKHLTLNQGLDGPDHKASLNPSQFRDMVLNIREAEISLGNFKKKLSKEEKENKNAGRRSLHASKNIKKGESFKKENITTLRPGIGMSPFSYWEILNKRAKRDYLSGDLIDE